MDSEVLNANIVMAMKREMEGEPLPLSLRLVSSISAIHSFSELIASVRRLFHSSIYSCRFFQQI